MLEQKLRQRLESRTLQTQQELDEKSVLLDQQRTELAEAESKIAETQQLAEARGAELADLESRLAAALDAEVDRKKKITTLEGHLWDFEENVAGLNRRLSDLQRELQEAQGAKLQSSQEHADALSGQRRLEEQVKALMAKLETQSDSDSKGQAELEQFRTNLQLQETKMEDLMGQKASLEQASEALHRKNELLNKAIEEAEASSKQRTSDLENEVARLLALLDEATSQLAEAEATATNLEQARAASSTDASDTRQRLELRLKESDSYAQTLREENVGLVAELNEAYRRQGEADQELERLRQLNAELEEEVRQLRAKLEELQRNQEAVRSEADKVVEAEKKAKAELATMQSHLQQTQSNMAEDLSRIAKLEAEVRTLSRDTSTAEPNKLRERLEAQVASAVLGPFEALLIDFANQSLQDLPKLELPLPLETKQLALAFLDGSLLCSLMARLLPGTLDTRVIHFSPVSRSQITSNINLALNSARGTGLSVFLTADDVFQGRLDFIFAFVFEVVRASLQQKINLHEHKEYFALKRADEGLEVSGGNLRRLQRLDMRTSSSGGTATKQTKKLCPCSPQSTFS